MRTRNHSLLFASILLSLSAAVGCEDSSTGPGVLNPPVPAPVLPDQPRTPTNWVLSDFEGGDLGFRMAEVSGYFTKEPEAAGLGVEGGGADNSAKALHLSSAASAKVKVVLSPALSPMVVLHDYSSCKAITFWAKLGAASGTGSSLNLIMESSAGASQAPVAATTDWKQFSFDLASVTSLATGATAPADLTKLKSFALESSGAADVWVDQVTLTACSVPVLNPPLPAAPPLGGSAPAGSPVAQHGQLRVEGTQILDQQGNPFQLKGVSTMWLDMGGMRYGANKQLLQWMRDDWHLSVIRAAMGVERAGGYISNSSNMMHGVETIINNAIELGVYVIVDWHYHNDAADPGQSRLQSKAFFDAVATKFGNKPNIIYETFNEPLKVSWSTDLKPYHVSIVETIRAKDPDNLIVLGTPQWSQKVEEAATDPLGGTNLLYSLHFYTCTHKEWLRTNADKALSLGLPLFATEWGGTNADGGTTGTLCDAETQTWLDWVNQRKISGAAWKLDGGSELSCILPPGASDVGPTWPVLHGHGPTVRAWVKGE